MKLGVALFFLSRIILVAAGGSLRADVMPLEYSDQAAMADGDTGTQRKEMEEDLVDPHAPGARIAAWKQDGRNFVATNLLKNKGRRFQNTFKYTSNDKSASIDKYREAPGCNSSAYNSIYLSVSNSIANFGDGETSHYNSGYFYLESWSNCTSSTATRTYTNFGVYEDGPSSPFSMTKSFKSASFKTTTNITFTIDTCQNVCYEEGYCYFDNCTTVSEDGGLAEIKATWKAKGAPANETSSATYSGTDYKSSSYTTGQVRASLASLSILYDGKPLKIPKGKLDGEIRKSKSDYSDTYY